MPCRVNGRATRMESAGGGLVSLASALMRQGGGYNAKPASKAKLPLTFARVLWCGRGVVG